MLFINDFVIIIGGGGAVLYFVNLSLCVIWTILDHGTV